MNSKDMFISKFNFYSILINKQNLNYSAKSLEREISNNIITHIYIYIYIVYSLNNYFTPSNYELNEMTVLKLMLTLSASIFRYFISGLCSLFLSVICLTTTSLMSMFVMLWCPTSNRFSLSTELPHPIIRMLSAVLTYLWRTPQSSGYSPYLT